MIEKKLYQRSIFFFTIYWKWNSYGTKKKQQQEQYWSIEHNNKVLEMLYDGYIMKKEEKMMVSISKLVTVASQFNFSKLFILG